MTIARLTVVLLMLMLAEVTQAETINCTPITSLPATIMTQGLYCLTGNLATSETSGAAITINANNVTLDLNGWKVGGQGAGTGTQAYGIYSSATNVTIKDGIVRGFYFGILLNGQGAVVQNMMVNQNTFVGISVDGLGSLVEHNQVVDTGGSTINSSVDAYGISSGSGALVSDNMVSGVTATGSGQETGISIDGTNSIARNNVVSNTALPPSGVTAYGIENFQGIALNNTVSNFGVGIENEAGGIYAYNTANNCTISYSGGTAGAGNSP
ncbi:MAG TPA: hypothetical protein VNF48_05430 [Gammaproteobacteria bacterium]|nr:hypothetical protein [Gammaproteobacteria bacterium]